MDRLVPSRTDREQRQWQVRRVSHAYDRTPLRGLMFSDGQGWWIEYSLDSGFAGRTLLSIVTGCMNGDRTQHSAETKWRNGHCSIGTRTRSAGVSGYSSRLRIGVGDSGSGSSDTDDWALFMPLTGNGAGDYSGSNTWAFGSEKRFNTGFNGMAYVHAEPQPPTQQQTRSSAEVCGADNNPVASKSTLDECSNSSFLSGRACLPGIDVVRSGFDVITGKLTAVPLFDFTFQLSKTFSAEFVLPDTLNAQQYETYQHGTNTHIFNSMESYYKARALAFGLGGTYRGVKIGVSWQSKHADETLVKRRQVLMESRRRRTLYVVSHTSMNPPLSRTFVQDASTLPTSYSASTYRKFISLYGTHYVQRATLGGEVTVNVALDKCYTSSVEEDTYKASLEVLAKEVLGLDASVGNNKSTQSSRLTVTFNEQLRVVGGSREKMCCASCSWDGWTRCETTFCSHAYISSIHKELALYKI